MMGRNHSTTANIIVWLSLGRNIVIIVLVIVLAGYGRCWVQNELMREREGEERRLMDCVAPQESDRLVTIRVE